MLKHPPKALLSLTGQVFGSLSTEHRAVLWNIEVERHSVDEVTTILGLTAKEVIIQLSMARVSFRNGWAELQSSNSRFSRACQWTARLTQTSGKTRYGLLRQPPVVAHLRKCLRCAILVDESEYLTQHLRETLAPILIPSRTLGPNE